LLTLSEFAAYSPGRDVYAEEMPDLHLDDLPRRYRGQPKLSYMISTWNRRAQLARSLESMARQTWRRFEVLLCDDGSTQDVRMLVDLFEPHLNLRYFRLERTAWHSCPSRAYLHMLPETRGQVVAIGHPEMMLHERAIEYLYRGCTEHLDDAHYYTIGRPERIQGDWYWVSLKPCFLDDRLYRLLDTVDWHSDWNATTTLPNFPECGGFAGWTNSRHAQQQEYPWWFVAAAARDCPIWGELPVIDSHGIIDMWFMRYRSVRGIVDVVPHQVLCLHQPHQTMAIGVAGEQDSPKLEVVADA